jgi:hypothetical protein
MRSVIFNFRFYFGEHGRVGKVRSPKAGLLFDPTFQLAADVHLARGTEES